MKVYVVITNGEVNGCVEGVFAKEEDARAKVNELVKGLKEWSLGDEFDEDETENFYCQTNFDKDEYNEVVLVERELQ